MTKMGICSGGGRGDFEQYCRRLSLYFDDERNKIQNSKNITSQDNVLIFLANIEIIYMLQLIWIFS